MVERVHVLKTDPEPFQHMLDGRKTAEVRYNDRGFEVGDTLDLREFDPLFQTWSGRALCRKITHILTGYGLPAGTVMLSLAHITPPDPQRAEAAARALIDHHAPSYELPFDSMTPSRKRFWTDAATAALSAADAVQPTRQDAVQARLLAVVRYCVDNPDFDSETLDKMARAALATTTDAAGGGS